MGCCWSRCAGSDGSGCCCAAGLALAPVLLANPPGWLLTGPGVAVIGYLAAVSTVGAYLLYGHGLRTVSPATAGTLTLAEAPCAAVIGVLVLREPLTGPGLAGLVLLSTALLVLSVPWPRRPSGRSTSTIRRLRAGNTLG